MEADEVVTGSDCAPECVPPPLPLSLTYASAALIARDRLPSLEHGLLARTTAPLKVGDRVDVTLDAQLESIRIRAGGRVHWVTSLATSKLVGLTLEGATAEDAGRLDEVLRSWSRGGTAPAPALTPALPYGTGSVLSVALFQPNRVLRQVLASSLERLVVRMGSRWTLRLEPSTTAEAFLTSLNDRVRHLAVVDCDAVPGSEEVLVRAIRSQEVYARLPIVILSGHRPAGLRDRFAVTMQKPLAVKSFLHTTELLLRA